MKREQYPWLFVGTHFRSLNYGVCSVREKDNINCYGITESTLKSKRFPINSSRGTMFEKKAMLK